MAPTLDSLSNKYAGQISFIKVDVDKNAQLSAQFEITAMPTFLLFRDGKRVGTIVGADPHQLEREIAKLVA